MPAAQSSLFCTASDVEAILSASGVLARTDDDADGSADGAYVDQAINYATARVKAYCQRRYTDSGAAGAWMVNHWAAALAAHWLCGRRGNPVPDSLQRLVFGDGGEDRGIMGELRAVADGSLPIPDATPCAPEGPAASNVSVDPRYRHRQLRADRVADDGTAPARWQDVRGVYSFEV